MPTTSRMAMAIRIARPCLKSPTARPKASTEAVGMSSSAQISSDIRPGVGVLERMRRIGVHEAAAVGAELLDHLLARHRPDRNGLLGAFERRHVDRAGQRLRHAERDEDDGEDDGDRQQDIEGDRGVISTQKLPTVVADERANARTSAKAMARPVAADRKLWTVRPSICVR